MKFGFFFSLVCVVSIQAFGINVKYGEVIVNGFEECDFENNGVKFVYKSYDENFAMDNKRLFGLINYNCSNHTGVLISKFESKPCGLFCNYNQAVARCRHIMIPYILGGVIGAIFGVIIKIFLKFAYERFKVKLVLWFNYKMMKRSDRKQIKKITEMKEITGITPNVIFKDTRNVNEEKMEKILQNREKFKCTNNSKEFAHSRNYSRIYPHLPIDIVILIIFGLLIGLVCACDNNLFVSSNGKICEKNKCKNLDMLSFPIQTGQSICFRDVNDDTLSITVTSTYYRTKYHHMYDTSEFEIKVETESLCGTYCEPSSCKMNEKYEKFVDKENKVEGYTCETKSSCDRYCFSDTSCTFIHWWLEPIGNVAKIYKYTSKIWEAKLLIKYREMNKIVLLNLNNPSYQITDIDFSVINNLPIFVNSFMGEDYFPNKNIIEDNMNFFHVDGSELNFPESDKIGDYQIEIKSNLTAIYNVNYIKCQADYCEASCTGPESKLKRFRKSKNPLKEIRSFEIKSEHIVEEKRRIVATFNIMIGNVDVVSLNIEKAMCNVNKISSYGCIGCNQKPYVIFKASSIKKEGIIPFESNCTFNKNYLSCTPDPFILEIDNLDSFCYIFMPSLNKTITIDTHIEFVGNLNAIQPEIMSENALSIAKNVLLNWDLANAATVAMAGATIFGVIITSFNKIFQVYLCREEIKSIQKNE